MKHDLNRNLQWRAKRLYALFACLVLTLPFAIVPAFAADDPLSVVTSLAAKGYRYLIVENYLVFYTISGQTVQIQRILYGRRNYQNIL